MNGPAERDRLLDEIADHSGDLRPEARRRLMRTLLSDRSINELRDLHHDTLAIGRGAW